jgi:nucleotide-binding universal stress UspA family protein
VSENNVGTFFKKVLVAVDGSKSSIDAAQAAVFVAEKYSALLIALNIISSEVRFEYNEYSIAAGVSGSFHADVKDALEKGQSLVDEVKKMASHRSINVQTDVIVAIRSIVDEIVGYAVRENIDLIVVGTRGMSGINKLLLGSTASGILRHSYCPVLIIK